MAETYFSTDVETDGPIPGPHSMLSFASVAFAADKTVLGEFTANLELLDGAAPHAATADFWAKNAEAYAATRTNLEAPAPAMRRYVEWVGTLPGKPVFVAYPAGFDFLFVYWYLMRFAGESPFSFSALDVKTFAMATLGCDYREATKRNMPKRWFDDLPHTHIALDDAREQGAMFCNLLRESRAQRRG